MNVQHLVKMANQIGSFFETEPDHQQAVQDIASHIKRFWEPRMRRAILSHLESGGDGLKAIVSEALSNNRQLLA